jgi:serine/threonine protein kinase
MMSLMNSGLIHRDIKPENIMRRSSGEIVLVDFGIATPAGKRTHTQSGTPDYLATDAGVDGWRPEDDIFGCGVVLYELLTGRLPYTKALGEKVSSPIDIRTWRDDLELELCECIMTACAPARADRFATAQRFAAALSACSR